MTAVHTRRRRCVPPVSTSWWCSATPGSTRPWRSAGPCAGWWTSSSAGTPTTCSTGGDPGQGTPIAQAGWNAEHLGRITLEVDEDGVRVVDLRVEAVPESAPADPVVLAELRRPATAT